MGITYTHGYVTPLMLYNGLNHPFSTMLPLDIRGGESNGASVAFAVVAESPLNAKKIGTQLVQTIEELRLKDVHLVIISDEKQQPRKIPRIIGNAMSIAEGRTGKFSRTSILQGGYQAFRREWGIMCADHSKYEHGRIFPNCVWQDGDRRVFVSNYGMATDAVVYDALGINSVVNCTPEVPFVDELKESKFKGKLRKMRIAIVDTPAEGSKLIAALDKACDFINEGLQAEGKCVLVHCKHGQSRSVAVVTAWMMSQLKITFEEASVTIKAQRPQARTKFEEPIKAWHAKKNGPRIF